MQRSRHAARVCSTAAGSRPCAATRCDSCAGSRRCARCSTAARCTTRRASTCTGSTRPRPSRWTTSPRDADDMRDFLDTCGYVLVRNVFTAEEIAGFLEDADVLARRSARGRQDVVVGTRRERRHGAVPGARAPRRARACARCTTTRACSRSPALVARNPCRARRKSDNDGVTVLWKRPDVKEGLADLPVAPRLRHGWARAQLPDRSS